MLQFLEARAIDKIPTLFKVMTVFILLTMLDGNKEENMTCTDGSINKNNDNDKDEAEIKSSNTTSTNPSLYLIMR